MRNLSKSIGAEWMKARHSGLWWLVGIMAVIGPLLMTIIALFVQKYEMEAEKQHLNYVFTETVKIYGGFLYPLTLILLTSRAVYMENKNDTWKLIEIQPISRLTIFASKFLTLLMQALVLIAGIMVLDVIACLIIGLCFPSAYHTLTINGIMSGAAIALQMWVAGIGLMAIQYFLCMLLRQMGAMIGIGFGFLIVGVILMQNNIAGWWPYSLPQKAVNYPGSKLGFYYFDQLSLTFAVPFLILAFLYYRAKQFKKAYVSTPGRGVVVASLVAAGIAGVAIFYAPKAVPAYGKTVLSGERLLPNKRIRLLHLDQTGVIQEAATDSLGNLHMKLPDDLPAGMYTVDVVDNRLTIYIPQKDSVHFKVNNQRAEIVCGGLAENEYLQSHFSYGLDYFSQEMLKRADPPQAFNTVRTQAQEMRDDLKSFRSSANTKLTNDFIGDRLDMIRVFEQQELTAYENKYRKFQGRKDVPWPAEAKTYIKSFDPNNPRWIRDKKFSEMIVDNYKAGNVRDSQMIVAIDRDFNNVQVHDKIMMEAISKRIKQIPDSNRQMLLEQMALEHTRNDSARALFNKILDESRRLRPGQPAPDLVFQDVQGKKLSLADLQGKNVLLDFWATWCGPCREEEPYYQELAEKYAGTSLSFISVSVDEDLSAWKKDMKGHSLSAVHQYYAGMSPHRTFQLQGIPRYLLISAEGRIINPELPKPSDDNFEKLLRAELPQLSSKDYND